MGDNERMLRLLASNMSTDARTLPWVARDRALLIQAADEMARLRDDLRVIAEHHDEQRGLALDTGDDNGCRYHEDRRNLVMRHLTSNAGLCGTRDASQLIEAMRQMLSAVATDECAGDSEYASGVNAACKRHTEGLRQIMAAIGVTPNA